MELEQDVQYDQVRSYEEAVKDADFINVYSWVLPEVFARGMETHFEGDPEFQVGKAKLKSAWCVDMNVVEMAKNDVQVMHCMPISRNTEVTDIDKSFRTAVL